MIRKSVITHTGPNVGAGTGVALLVWVMLNAIPASAECELPINGFQVPSGSMIPTINMGETVFSVCFRHALLTFSGERPASVEALFPQIVRGDIVVFKYPRDNVTDYIKRIVGLPGDRIQVKQGQLYINGDLVPRQSAGDYVADDSGIHMVVRRYLESLPGGVDHYILKQTDEGDANNTPEYIVPPGHLFVLGDNRDNSADSRFMNGVGFVPLPNLVALVYEGFSGQRRPQ